MSGKGRFDIDADFEDVSAAAETAATETPSIGRSRLGPMAKAIEDAGRSAAQYRDVSSNAEKTALEMALDLKRLRKANLDLRQIALGDIDETYLKRDREEIDSEALDDLKRSIAAKGLSSPIRVDALAGGGYGLNQGLRRLMAFRQLRSETGDEKYAVIPAFVDQETERESAYRRMVDENLIRENVTFGEMGLLAIAYAEESGCTPEEAVSRLYASAAKAKRSQIMGFVRLLSQLGDLLKYPAQVPRNLGLSVSVKLKTPEGLSEVRRALQEAVVNSPEEEHTALEGALKGKSPSKKNTRRAPAESFRLFVGPQNKRRVDVSVKAKSITIAGLNVSEVDLDELKAFVQEMCRKGVK